MRDHRNGEIIERAECARLNKPGCTSLQGGDIVDRRRKIFLPQHCGSDLFPQLGRNIRIRLREPAAQHPGQAEWLSATYCGEGVWDASGAKVAWFNQRQRNRQNFVNAMM